MNFTYHMLSVVPNQKARAELAKQMHCCHFWSFVFAGRQAGLLSPHLVFRFLQTHRRHCKSWKLEKIKLKWFVHFGLIKAQSPIYLHISTYHLIWPERNFLCQNLNSLTFCDSPFSKFSFCAGTKSFGAALNSIQFSVWTKTFWDL